MSGGPLGEGDMNPAKLARAMRSPRQIAQLLKDDVPGLDASSAEILCDIINVMRADVRMLGRVHDVEIETKQMTEDRAADLVAGIVDGDGLELVAVFNEIAHKRDEVLREALEDEQHERFMEQKVAMMHTADPVTWDDEDGEDGGSED